MPILDDKLFEGRNDPFEPFVSALPDEHIMEGAAISASYAQIVKQLPAAQLINAAKNTRSITAGVATTIGIAGYALRDTESNPLGELSKLVDLDLSYIPAGAFSTNPATLVRDVGLFVAEQVIDRVLTKMPVLGIVAKVGIMFYRAVEMLRQDVEARPKSYVNPIAYHKQADEELCNDILGAVRHAHDLTFAFMPAMHVTGWLPYKTRTDHGLEGTALSMRGTDGSGKGLVPGFAEVGDTVQYPDKGQSRATTQSFGDLHPSTAQLSVVLWQAVLRNGPLAFTIDGAKIATAWEAYYETLLDYAGKLDGDDAEWQWRRIAQVSTWAQYGTPEAWGRYFPERQSASGLPPTLKCKKPHICVPERYCQWRGRSAKMLRASKGGLVRYFVEKQWQAKLRYYLGTLTCAYVPAGAPALAADAALAEYHDEMRTLLLTHKARYKVDLDMVPDDGTGFRSQLARSRMAVGKGLAIELPKDVPEPKLKPLVARAIDDVPPVDPELEGLVPDLVPDDPAIPGPDVAGGSAIGILIAAGVGALLLGTLRGVR